VTNDKKKSRTFALRMRRGRIETILTRIVSTTFVVVALAVFKPFGLDALHWQAYFHLLMLWLLGIMVCMLTDVIVKYGVKKPRAYDKGVSYIIRRNLWFQLINTPLVALAICFYRHFLMNDRTGSNQLSWTNFLETLAIIAFCSFAIGLYWRFKFRNRSLATELEETRLLNEQLNKMRQTASDKEQEVALKTETPVTLTGTTNEAITLHLSDLLYVEAVGNYVKVFYLREGEVHNDTLRATLKHLEDEMSDEPKIVRCHRAFLVNLGQVEKAVSRAGTMHLVIKHNGESVPVSRSNMTQVKEAVRDL
jgi:hypothetical protein